MGLPEYFVQRHEAMALAAREALIQLGSTWVCSAEASRLPESNTRLWALPD
jgi:hypothetical protein